MDDTNIVEIYSAANSIDAYAVANALESAGIKARVVGDILGTAAGGLAVGVPIAPRVWVLEEDQARARKLLKELKSEAQIAPESPDVEE